MAKPTAKSQKKDIIKYLKAHDIKFDESLGKAELLKLIDEHKAPAHAHTHAHAETASTAAARKAPMGARARNIVIGVVVVVIILAIVLSLAYRPAGNGTAAGNPGAVVATVNGVQITAGEVATLKSRLATQLAQPVNDSMALDQAVIQELLRQEVQKQGLTVSAADAEANLTATLQEQGQTLDALKQQLAQQNITYAEALDNYRLQMGVQKLIAEVLTPVQITDQQAEDFYNQNKDQFVQGNTTYSYAQMASQIKAYLANQQQSQEFLTYINKLKSQADIVYK